MGDVVTLWDIYLDFRAWLEGVLGELFVLRSELVWGVRCFGRSSFHEQSRFKG